MIPANLYITGITHDMCINHGWGSWYIMHGMHYGTDDEWVYRLVVMS
jgi:hypothetical protein